MSSPTCNKLQDQGLNARLKSSLCSYVIPESTCQLLRWHKESAARTVGKLPVAVKYRETVAQILGNKLKRKQSHLLNNPWSYCWIYKMISWGFHSRWMPIPMRQPFKIVAGLLVQIRLQDQSRSGYSGSLGNGTVRPFPTSATVLLCNLGRLL